MKNTTVRLALLSAALTFLGCPAPTKECTINTDCMAGQICSANKCVAGNVGGGGGTTGGGGGTTSPVDTSIVPADRRTVWNPGILNDDLLNLPLTADRLPTRTTVCGTANAATYGNNSTDATAHIQGLINSCPSGQVVYVPAGTYRTSDTIELRSGVVLRGAGSSQTRLLKNPSAGGSAVIEMGTEVWGWDNGTVVNVVGDLPKGSKQITVSDGTTFQVGDFVYIDQLDDTSYNVAGDSYGSRISGVWRTLVTMGEVAAKSGDVLTVKDPVHHNFPASHSPQVLRMPRADFTTWAGVEGLYVTGGHDRAGLVRMNRAAYCWIRDVEANGQLVAGDPMRAGATFGLPVQMSYRCVIRDSYVHDASQYGNSTDSYGIVIWQGTTNTLVENCISVWRNKPIQFQTSGGGNVIGYCYADNALDTNSPDSTGNAFWMENAINSHLQFPHHELIEGCYASQIGMDGQHGGSGWITAFRNHVAGKTAGGTTVGQSAPSTFPDQYGNVSALGFYEGSRYPTAIGNVLLIPGQMRLPKAYMLSPSDGNGDQAYAFTLGFTQDAAVKQTAHLHLNFDYASGQVVDNATNPVKILPNSLYLTSKPAFFGAAAWPWVNPAGGSDSARLQVLPAKARFDDGRPNDLTPP